MSEAFSRERFLELVAEKQGQQRSPRSDRRPDLERLAQADVEAKYLTDSEPWNVALSLMESTAKECEEKIAECREALETTVFSDDGQLRFHQTRLLVFRAQLEQLREIMELPAKMRATSEMAKRAIEEEKQGEG